MQICKTCGIEKPFSEYTKDSGRKSGRGIHCKICKALWSRKYRAENPDISKQCKEKYNKSHAEQNKARKKIYRIENKEKIRAQSKIYSTLNRDKIKAYQKLWQENNPSKLSSYYRKYRKKNPELMRRHEEARRFRKAGSFGVLSKDIKSKLFKSQKGMCPCCRRPLGAKYHLDHIMPLALGGSNEDNNVQLLRARCNLQKKAAHPVDFMRSRGFLI